MGYGGSVKEAGKAPRKTADEGIDGVIKEDRLGLDAIYLQAKTLGGCCRQTRDPKVRRRS